MINVNDLKNGMTIKYEGVVYQVVEFQHVKPGKGTAFVRTKLKNLKKGTTQEVTFNSDTKIEKANVEKRNYTYLYSNGDSGVFMDMENFDQVDSRAYLVHAWLKYPKFGHASATDYSARMIRYGEKYHIVIGNNKKETKIIVFLIFCLMIIPPQIYRFDISI